MKIVIASSHGYKIRETKTFLKQLGSFDIFSLTDFPNYHSPKEIGCLPEENALAKGLHAAKELNSWVIADDTMLMVPALNGLPGKLSATFAGTDACDKDHRKKLLQEMQSLESIVDRSAYFECCIVLASPEGKFFKARGICEGYISNQEKGSSGFGYDSLFLKYDYKQTFAELSEDVKNQVSHRAKALQKLTPYLQDLLEKHLLFRN
ncbi:RdgB/HAM1 family non-canonical purine NTP pyrophosphatase [Chlamydia sp. 12-01]|uniref:RdgB/HAM1 family non-canonical purine NTP pyrophosphatase n=1 Tax=Chlamydia sp. 12-01 TaxID=3002742 RepID=UPI0035D4A036